MSTLGALRVLRRAGLLDPLRPDDALRSTRQTLRIGPVAAAIARGARRHPERTAVVDDDEAVTFAELDRRSRCLARAMAGVEQGRRPVVGVLCRDHGRAVVAMAAAGRLGARLVLLNTGFAGPQLLLVLEREGVDVLVLDEEFRSVADGLAGTMRVVVADGDAADGITALIASAPAGPDPRPRRSGGLVVLTSGTTGTPKGAPRDRVSPLQTAQILDRIPLPANGCVVLAAPVFHGTGLSQFVLALALGSTVVLSRRFDAERALASVERHGAQAMVVVPTMLHRILDLPPGRIAARDLSSLTAVYAAGSALSPALCVRSAELLGPVLHNVYGSTEVGIAAVATPAELALSPGCVGRPPIGSRVELVDDDGRIIDVPDVTGTIHVASTLNFRHYTDGSSKETIDGMLSTGDRGHRDRHGLLVVDGRADDMIVSGGENVYPGAVEDLIADLDEVAEVAVVGVDDAEFGQRLRAVVVLTPGSSLDPAVIREHVRDRLARHQVPRDVVFTASLPRNAMGKVLRRELPDGDPG